MWNCRWMRVFTCISCIVLKMLFSLVSCPPLCPVGNRQCHIIISFIWYGSILWTIIRCLLFRFPCNVCCSILCVKMHQLWNCIAQNYKDWFWCHLGQKYSKFSRIEFVCFSFHVGLLFTALSSLKLHVCMFLLLTGNAMHNFRHFRWFGLGQIFKKTSSF